MTKKQQKTKMPMQPNQLLSREGGEEEEEPCSPCAHAQGAEAVQLLEEAVVEEARESVEEVQWS